jgi:hypothetical protein
MQRKGGAYMGAIIAMRERITPSTRRCAPPRINARCNIRNVIPLAYRPLRNEDVAVGSLAGALPTGCP